MWLVNWIQCKHRLSEVINDSVLDFLHQFPSSLDLSIRHLIFLLLHLSNTNISLVNSVFLKNDGLNCWLRLCFLHLLLPFFLLLSPDPFTLLHQSLLSIFLRLLLRFLLCDRRNDRFLLEYRLSLRFFDNGLFLLLSFGRLFVFLLDSFDGR